MAQEYSSTNKTHISEAQWYSSCWSYFDLLSRQRMNMFQFFISLEVFLCGSLITLISLESRLSWAEAAISALVFLMSIIFGCFDYRTKTMIHCCEEAMMSIEQNDESSVQHYPIDSVNSCKKAKLTYSKLIFILQALFFICGVISFISVIFEWF